MGVIDFYSVSSFLNLPKQEYLSASLVAMWNGINILIFNVIFKIKLNYMLVSAVEAHVYVYYTA